MFDVIAKKDEASFKKGKTYKAGTQFLEKGKGKKKSEYRMFVAYKTSECKQSVQFNPQEFYKTFEVIR